MNSPKILLFGLLCATLSLTPITAYIEKVLENDCVNNFKLIGREYKSAIVLRNSQYWTGKHEFNCQFTVSSSFELGVFAVIQRLSLRRDAQGQCIDYVQFHRHSEKTIRVGSLNLTILDPWSDKICGNMNALEVNCNDELNINNNNDDNKTVLNSFIDHKGLIEVKIHFANKSLDVGEELSFEIVFTAFQVCKYDIGHWKSCGSSTCIYREFFKDGKCNCPYKSYKDESSYPVVDFKGTDYPDTNSEIKYLIGAVSVIFTVIMAFFAFIHFTNLNIYPAPRDSSAASANKDLPPPYESLFPTKL